MSLKKIIGLILCIGCISTVFFFDLGKNALGNWDEAWYADVSRTMAVTDDYITPAWNKGLFFDKPPMYYWVTVPFYKTIENKELAVRLPSAISGILTCVLIGIIVYKTTGSFLASMVTVIALISMPGYVSRVRTGNMDSLFTLFIIASAVFWERAVSSSTLKWWTYAGLALSFGFLTKGFGVFAFFFIAVATSLIFHRGKKDFIGYTIAGSIAFLTSSFWFGISYGKFGVQFLETFFGHQSGKLLTSWMIWENFSSDFARFLVSGLKMWIIPFLFVFPLALRVFYKKYTAFPFLAFIPVFFALISCSVNRSNWFLVPLYPFIAISIGFSYAFIIRRKNRKRIDVIIVLLTLVLSGIQYYRYWTEFFPPDVNRAQALISMQAGKILSQDDILYMTQYYYPATAYYSGRKTISVYGNNQDAKSWWIIPFSSWNTIMIQKRVFVLTTNQDLEKAEYSFLQDQFNQVAHEGDMILLKKL